MGEASSHAVAALTKSGVFAATSPHRVTVEGRAAAPRRGRARERRGICAGQALPAQRPAASCVETPRVGGDDRRFHHDGPLHFGAVTETAGLAASGAFCVGPPTETAGLAASGALCVGRTTETAGLAASGLFLVGRTTGTGGLTASGAVLVGGDRNGRAEGRRPPDTP